MTRIFLASEGVEAWKRGLAQPNKHWRTGYSARTLASCWEAADGLPNEVSRVLTKAAGGGKPAPQLLLALPEFKVPLPGGERASQSDIFALISMPHGLLALCVEGKVDEEFGPLVKDKMSGASAGQLERIAFMSDKLALDGVDLLPLRYQLLHRTVSALLLAERFRASMAAMFVHSFSPTRRWFDDFAAFASAFGVKAEADVPLFAGTPGGMPLLLAWCTGDQKFRLA